MTLSKDAKTDIIKDFPEPDSKKVKNCLTKHPEILERNLRKFDKELNSLGVENSAIVAFGDAAYRYLKIFNKRYP